MKNDDLIIELLALCAFAPGKGCRTRGGSRPGRWCAVCRAAGRLERSGDTYLRAEIKSLREKLRQSLELQIRLTHKPILRGFDGVANGLPWRREVEARRARGVYFIKAGEYIKIGKSEDVRKRLQQLNAKTTLLDAEPVAFIPIAEDSDRDLYSVELGIHSLFKEIRVRGEWFKDCPALRAYIAENAEEWPISEFVN